MTNETLNNLYSVCAQSRVIYKLVALLISCHDDNLMTKQEIIESITSIVKFEQNDLILVD